MVQGWTWWSKIPTSVTLPLSSGLLPAPTRRYRPLTTCFGAPRQRPITRGLPAGHRLPARFCNLRTHGCSRFQARGRLAASDVSELQKAQQEVCSPRRCWRFFGSSPSEEPAAAHCSVGRVSWLGRSIVDTECSRSLSRLAVWMKRTATIERPGAGPFSSSTGKACSMNDAFAFRWRKRRGVRNATSKTRSDRSVAADLEAGAPHVSVPRSFPEQCPPRSEPHCGGPEGESKVQRRRVVGFSAEGGG